MSNSTCTVDECNRPNDARGLCKMHYKRQHAKPPTKHPVICDGCGIEYLVERPGRGKTHHCSELCRQWSQFGAWSVALPSDHWARIYGATCAYSPKLPARQLVCEWCGIRFSTKSIEAKFCSRKHKNRTLEVRRRAQQFNAPGTYTWADITRLWLLFDKRCAYCSNPTPLPDIQAEHVIALSCGGSNNVSNLLPSCAPCNADKRELTLSQWAAERTRLHKSPVRTTWTDTDTRFAHLSFVPTLVA